METSQTQGAIPKPKIKHDWYQTETHVIITILLKNAVKEQVKINSNASSLSVTCPIPGSDSEYSLELDLWNDISDVTFVTMASKIEIKIKKVQGLRWENLERKIDQIKNDNIKPIPQCVVDASGPQYPSSCPFKKDWNKIESEIKKQEAEEKPEGEEALKSLFEQIYGQGNDEVRKAMNKSYMESGGTVLSTNWNEVSKDKVKIQPPDGMEWKKWDS